MPEPRREWGLAGVFDERDALLRAAARVRDAGYRDWDCHVPFPVHGLSRAMGLGASRLPRWTLGAGFSGAALALWMQQWMSEVDYPLRIAGKPLFSWPAFVPITFEMFVLFAALATTAGLVHYGRLWRWYSPLYDQGLMAEVTTRRFAIVVSARDPRFAPDALRALFQSEGCTDVRTLYEPDPEVSP